MLGPRVVGARQPPGQLGEQRFLHSPRRRVVHVHRLVRVLFVVEQSGRQVARFLFLQPERMWAGVDALGIRPGERR